MTVAPPAATLDRQSPTRADHQPDLHPDDRPGPGASDTALEEFSERIFRSVLGAFDVLAVHVGDQLGLYRLLADDGPLTAGGLARSAGISPRYAREWLEQQTVAGTLTVDDHTEHAAARRYRLPAAQASVLADPDHLAFSAPFARLVAAAAGQLPALLEAYRTGGGVSWDAFGPLMRTAQADANRPLFLRLLGEEWLPTLPDVHAALSAGGRVADIGCGEGWSSIGIARAYPSATVDGFDVDEASVSAALGHVSAHGLADRVRMHLADPATTPTPGEYDLVAFFECVHDLPDPVSVLAAARRMVATDGTVLVMDERVPEEFTGPGDPVEQLMYGYSMFVCLPDGLSHPTSVGTGTVMRPAVLEGYAREAGFSRVEVLPIEHDFFRVYRLLA